MEIAILIIWFVLSLVIANAASQPPAPQTLNPFLTPLAQAAQML